MELAKQNPDEKLAGQLIEKMSSLEGQRVRSRVVTWLKIRRLLTAKQRKELRRLRNIDGRNIVTTQGVFINPFESFENEERSRAADEIVNPFGKATRRPPGLANPNARGRLQLTTSSPARIFIDGKARGQAPLDARLALGKHRIRVVFLDGSSTKRKTVDLRKGRLTNIHVVAGASDSSSPFNPYQ